MTERIDGAVGVGIAAVGAGVGRVARGRAGRGGHDVLKMVDVRRERPAEARDGLAVLRFPDADIRAVGNRVVGQREIEAVALADEAVGAVGVRNGAPKLVVRGGGAAVVILQHVRSVGGAVVRNIQVAAGVDVPDDVILPILREQTEALAGRIVRRSKLNVRAAALAAAGNIHDEAVAAGGADCEGIVAEIKRRREQAPFLRFAAHGAFPCVDLGAVCTGSGVEVDVLVADGADKAVGAVCIGNDAEELVDVDGVTLAFVHAQDGVVELAAAIDVQIAVGMRVADGVVAVAAIFNGKSLAVGLGVCQKLNARACLGAVADDVHDKARVAVRAELVDAVRHRSARNERPVLRSRSVAGIALDSLTVRRCAAAVAVDVQAVALADEAIGAVGIRDDEELVVLAGAVLPLDDACSVGRAAAGNVEVLIRMQEAHRVVAVAAVLDGDRMELRPDMHARAVFGAVARDVPAITGILRNGDVIHTVGQRVDRREQPFLSVGLISGINLNVVALSRADVGKIQIQAVALGLNIIVSVPGTLERPELRAAVVGNVLLDVRSGILIAAVDVEHHAGGHVADGIAAVPDRLEDKLLRKHVAVCTDLDVCAALRAVARNGDEAVGVRGGGDGIGAVIDGHAAVGVVAVEAVLLDNGRVVLIAAVRVERADAVDIVFIRILIHAVARGIFAVHRAAVGVIVVGKPALVF